MQKVRRDIWSSRQVRPWSTKWSRTKAKRFCQENTLVRAITLFQQHKRQLYIWILPDGQYWNQITYIICIQRWRRSIQSAKTSPGADCGSDELLIAKFRLKLKKVGKTTRPFRYDLNQIPYYDTVEVMDRFKGFDLVDSMPEELWVEVYIYIVQWQTVHCKGKEMQEGKVVVLRGLTNSWERKKNQRQGERRKIYSTECRVPGNSKMRYVFLRE